MAKCMPSLWSLERDKMSGNQDLLKWQNACHHSDLWRGINEWGRRASQIAKCMQELLHHQLKVLSETN
jgi:hypothetical protein